MKKLKFLKVLKGFCKHHGSLLLTIASVIGVVASTVMAAFASRKADENVRQAKEDKAMKEAAKEGTEMTEEMVDNTELTRKEKFFAKGKAYVWTAIVVGATIVCVVGSHIVSASQIRDGLAAVSLVHDGKRAYEEKTGKVVGKEKAAEIKREVSKEKSAKSRAENDGVIARMKHDPDDVLYYFEDTDTWFYAKPSNIEHADDELVEFIKSSPYTQDGDEITLEQIADAINGELDHNVIKVSHKVGSEIKWYFTNDVDEVLHRHSDMLSGGFPYIVISVND